MAIRYSLSGDTQFFFNREEGTVYEKTPDGTSLLVWKNGVKSRVPVADLPQGCELLWCQEASVWQYVRTEVDE